MSTVFLRFVGGGEIVFAMGMLEFVEAKGQCGVRDETINIIMSSRDQIDYVFDTLVDEAAGVFNGKEAVTERELAIKDRLTCCMDVIRVSERIGLIGDFSAVDLKAFISWDAYEETLVARDTRIIRRGDDATLVGFINSGSDVDVLYEITSSPVGSEVADTNVMETVDSTLNDLDLNKVFEDLSDCRTVRFWGIDGEGSEGVGTGVDESLVLKYKKAFMVVGSKIDVIEKFVNKGVTTVGGLDIRKLINRCSRDSSQRSFGLIKAISDSISSTSCWEWFKWFGGARIRLFSFLGRKLCRAWG